MELIPFNLVYLMARCPPSTVESQMSMSKHRAKRPLLEHTVEQTLIDSDTSNSKGNQQTASRQESLCAPGPTTASSSATAKVAGGSLALRLGELLGESLECFTA